MDKVGGRKAHSRLKSTELSGRGSPKHIANASLVRIPCDSQSRRDSTKKEAVRPTSLAGKGNFPVKWGMQLAQVRGGLR